MKYLILILLSWNAHAMVAPSECISDLRKGVDPGDQKFLECQSTCHFMAEEPSADKWTDAEVIENQSCVVLSDLRIALQEGDLKSSCQWLFDKAAAPMFTAEESAALKKCVVHGFMPKEKPRPSGSIFSQRIPLIR